MTNQNNTNIDKLWETFERGIGKYRKKSDRSDVDVALLQKLLAGDFDDSPERRREVFALICEDETWAAVYLELQFPNMKNFGVE